MTIVQDVTEKRTEKKAERVEDHKLIEQMYQARLLEMEAREEILKAAKLIDERRVWEREGYRSLQMFCMDRCGYNQAESRGIAIAVGAILTANRLRVESPEAQFRLEALREWRRILARVKGVPSYRIFSNRMLMDLASANPRTIADLQKIKGFGPRRIEAFGSDLVTHLNVITSSTQRTSNH